MFHNSLLYYLPWMAGAMDIRRLLETGCCRTELVPGANIDGWPTRVVFEVVLQGTNRWQSSATWYPIDGESVCVCDKNHTQ